MHRTLLKALDEMGGTGTTTEVLKHMAIVSDNAMYSAFDYFERQGKLSKSKDGGSGRNTWTMTEDGYQVINTSTDIASFKEYEKHWLNIRKKANKKSPQKDLLAPAPKPKKAPEVDMGPMSEAANAAVDGIARVVEENQQLHRERKQLKQIYLQLHAIFGN